MDDWICWFWQVKWEFVGFIGSKTTLFAWFRFSKYKLIKLWHLSTKLWMIGQFLVIRVKFEQAFAFWILLAQLWPFFEILKISSIENLHLNKIESWEIHRWNTKGSVIYFSFLSAWIQMLRNSPYLLLLT